MNTNFIFTTSVINKYSKAKDVLAISAEHANSSWFYCEFNNKVLDVINKSDRETSFIKDKLLYWDHTKFDIIDKCDDIYIVNEDDTTCVKHLVNFLNYYKDDNTVVVCDTKETYDYLYKITHDIVSIILLKDYVNDITTFNNREKKLRCLLRNKKDIDVVFNSAIKTQLIANDSTKDYKTLILKLRVLDV